MLPNGITIPTLLTERLIVRLPEAEDAHSIAKYYRDNHAHFAKRLNADSPAMSTATFWEAEVARILEDAKCERAYKRFAFRRSDPTTPIAFVSLFNIIRGAFQACYLGYRVDSMFERKGYMFEAVGAVVADAYQTLFLHRIMSNYMVGNERSARLLQRLGFNEECVAKEYLLVNGTWTDHVLTSKINPTWRDPNIVKPD
jgi:ribosomal-protein-alanine N-acetyltransferase